MPDPFNTLSEEALARLVRENVPDAFPELCARCAGLIRGKAAQFTGPAAPEQEDLFQEGLWGLYIAAASYDEAKGASFRTYAGVCVQNRMADAARRHGSSKNRPLNESLSLDSEAAAGMAAETGPEDLLELRDRVRRLEEALTPLERKALALYLSGCKREDIETAGMSRKAFDNALYRVRAKLKEK